MTTENEKAVRDPFEHWFSDRFGANADYIVAKSFIREAWFAALQSQVSNTPQDGELERRERLLDGVADALGVSRDIWRIATCDAIVHYVQDTVKNLRAFMEAPPQQQEQSGKVIAYQKAINVCDRAFEMAHSTDVGYRLACSHIREDLTRLAKISTSPATPTATASQESAPGQEAVVETVARVLRDPELGVRVEWLIEGGAGACLDQVLLASPTKLTNDEGYGTVYLTPPTSTAIAAMVIKQAATKVGYTWGVAAEKTVLSVLPANAEAELEALMMKVAEALNKEFGAAKFHEHELPAIVRRVLDEKGE